MSKTKAELEAGTGEVALLLAEYDSGTDMVVPRFTFNDAKDAIMAGRVAFVKFSAAGATGYGIMIEPVVFVSLNNGTYQVSTPNLSLEASSPDVFMQVADLG